MTGSTNNIIVLQGEYLPIDGRDAYTCSFQEFLPFCVKLYYFSNFKDFKTNGRA
ncbi:MAG: hypothetical protein ABI813_08035 [Bacteroidota bacterium]